MPKEGEKVGRIEFEHGGEVWAYDFDSEVCGYERFLQAHAIWHFQQRVYAAKPETFAELQETGATEADRRALAWLLIEVDEDGKDMEFHDQSIARATAFLKGLPMREHAKLKEVKDDFFGRAGLYNVVSMQELASLYGASTNGMVARLIAQSTSEQTTEQPTLPDASPPEPSSSSPENSTGDSTDETPRVLDTTGVSES